MNILTLEGNGKTSSASARRKINIEFVRALSLEGLDFQLKEKMVLLYTTTFGEKLYMQFPGKESIRDTNPNTWDFRPKLFVSGVQFGNDLSFGDVWESFFDLLKIHSVTSPRFLKAIDYLIVLFYKSAYLIDYQEVKGVNMETRLRKSGIVDEAQTEKFTSPLLLFDVDLHREILDYLQGEIGNLCGMSIEAFLLYNDILGWNEDSKYYQRAIEINKVWSDGVGKPNTLLTHISILGYIRNELKMSDILMRFVRSRGVSYPTRQELQKIFDDFINPVLTLL